MKYLLLKYKMETLLGITSIVPFMLIFGTKTHSATILNAAIFGLTTNLFSIPIRNLILKSENENKIYILRKYYLMFIIIGLVIIIGTYLSVYQYITSPKFHAILPI